MPFSRETLAALLSRSAIVRALDQLASGVEFSTRRSRVVATLRRMHRGLRVMSVRRQLDAIGTFLIAFAVAYYLMAAAMPQRSAPAWPSITSLPIAIIGVVLLLAGRSQNSKA